jgi:hypothetical protein
MPRLEEHSPQSIKRSVAQMLQGGASEQEIDLYLSTYGMTAQDLPVSDKYTMGRAGYQTLGGMMGGVTAAEFGVTAPAIKYPKHLQNVRNLLKLIFCLMLYPLLLSTLGYTG